MPQFDTKIFKKRMKEMRLKMKSSLQRYERLHFGHNTVP